MRPAYSTLTTSKHCSKPHYLGSAIRFTGIGHAMAEAIRELLVAP
jgi:hypothetical protein